MIEITFANSSLVRTTKWQVSDLYTHIDHLAIILEIGNQEHTQGRKTPKKAQTRGWKIETLDENLFKSIGRKPKRRIRRGTEGGATREIRQQSL